MPDVIANRYEFVVLFDVENGNPNGDPDAGNMPRMDLETGIGLVTDVCLKRKIRDYVDTVKDGADGFRIYIKNDASLNEKDEEACHACGIDTSSESKLKASLSAEAKKDPDLDAKLRAFMCENFYDIRTFGAVMSTFTKAKAGLNCGQVRGPVQISFAKSIDPIVPMELSITRVAITKKSDADEKSTEMGRKYIVPYALYRAEGFISANLAKKATGFSEEDLALLWDAIINMFEHDRSAARGKMCVRELIVFKHDTELGSCPAWKLFDMVRVEKKSGIDVPQKYQDYDVIVDAARIPGSVQMTRMI